MATAPMSIAEGELIGVNASIAVSSPAFGPDEPIPSQYTADGEGLSPPLEWRGVPMNAEAVVLVIEDADEPAQSRANSIAWDLPGSDTSLPEGALPCTCPAGAALSATYLPPDPPPGRGPHRYAFQVFALDTVPRFESQPGRTELLDKIKGHVIAKGLLIGTYERT
jgi:Raf kinase inhibitor-like YbhB/YbcL family protein